MKTAVEDLAQDGSRKAFIVSSPPLHPFIEAFQSDWEQTGGSTLVFSSIEKEPDLALFQNALDSARRFQPDVVVGLGGGSALDVAKLVAAMLDIVQPVREFFGIGLLPSRNTRLICLPTTSGTGSEVSPNAILLDEKESLKKGVVSPFLMPDGAYIDPELTWSVPPSVTAATGVDALTHCIEAFANKHAHPVIDQYALEGIKRIARSLEDAIADGHNRDARADLALGSVYGGICLGPVNTGAVHALSYPLGGEFHIPHGVSNAVLLPHVLRFNLPAAADRYADVASALGIAGEHPTEDRASRAIDWLSDFVERCGIPRHLAEFGIPEDQIPHLAREALKVTRLLVNNPREVSLADAESIYRSAY